MQVLAENSGYDAQEVCIKLQVGAGIWGHRQACTAPDRAVLVGSVSWQGVGQRRQLAGFLHQW